MLEFPLLLSFINVVPSTFSMRLFMVYQEKTISLSIDSGQVAHMRFDAKDQPINKFDIETIEELRSCVTLAV